MALPTTLNPATPGTNDALDQGDDQIRALKLLLADYLGIPVDPTSLTAAVAAIAGDGTPTFLQNIETKAGTAFKGIITHANTVDRTYTFPDYTSRVLQAGFGSIGQTSKNNASNPNTQFDLDADVIWLRNSNNDVVVRYNPGAAITNNVGTAGPIINGRDQGAAFTPSSWLHLYWIWDGTTLATVSSQTAPPTGPTLPTDYTHWCYAGAIFFGSLSTLAHIYIRGNTAYYDAQASVISGQHANTTQITLSLTAFIPPNASSFLGHVMAAVGATGGGSTAGTVTLRFITGSDVLSVRPHTSVASGFGTDSMAFEMPNISQQMFYLWTDESAFVFARTLNISIVGYRLPNGG